ncbi:MAG: hypothetical protein QN183_14135 [Armatimonadota bacterium]|nr:hypothetical protein [Armatimonadota bacterium]MDR7486911.1 hypothetical protein [Armatimonadota bacterium]MDR7534318.1 hypothetical protein [Armatimonadota bacterium]MDR7537488.1 hypothetical protein [Armatimonadota bacterium]
MRQSRTAVATASGGTAAHRSWRAPARRAVLAGSSLLIALAPLALRPVAAQSGPQLVITMALAGPVQTTGGAYYIAFTVSDSLLQGPQPDSTNWTHYVVFRDGRFFFGVVPPQTVQPFGFVVIRPPAPFLFGQVLPDGQSLRVSVPLADLRVSPTPPTRVMVNFVTVDGANRPLDALGPGAGDRFGFVTVDLRRDLFVPVRDPRGDAPQAAFDITGGEIRVATP